MSTSSFSNRDPSTCARKKRYRSFRTARRAASFIYHDTGNVTHAFACLLCRGVHVGRLRDDDVDDPPPLRVPKPEPSVRGDVDDLGLEIETVFPIR